MQRVVPGPDARAGGARPRASSPRVVRLTLGYRGTRYAGWARQAPDKTAGRGTIQGLVEGLLAELLGHPVALTAAGRTDAGVHAEAQVASFSTTATVPAEGIAGLLRTHLPDDVWLVSAADVGPGFDARRRALRRWYRYALWLGPSPPAMWQGRCLAHPAPLDVRAMRRAARSLLGRHDMASLATGRRVAAARPRSSVRTVYAADWLRAEGSPLLLFEVCADAFLRQMVRTMVGSMLWIGHGTWPPDRLRAALAAADRRAAGPTAPAVGLTLVRVEY